MSPTTGHPTPQGTPPPPPPAHLATPPRLVLHDLDSTLYHGVSLALMLRGFGGTDSGVSFVSESPMSKQCKCTPRGVSHHTHNHTRRLAQTHDRRPVVVLLRRGDEPGWWPSGALAEAFVCRFPVRLASADAESGLGAAAFCGYSF